MSPVPLSPAIRSRVPRKIVFRPPADDLANFIPPYHHRHTLCFILPALGNGEPVRSLGLALARSVRTQMMQPLIGVLLLGHKVSTTFICIVDETSFERSRRGLHRSYARQQKYRPPLSSLWRSWSGYLLLVARLSPAVSDV